MVLIINIVAIAIIIVTVIMLLFSFSLLASKGIYYAEYMFDFFLGTKNAITWRARKHKTSKSNTYRCVVGNCAHGQVETFRRDELSLNIYKENQFSSHLMVYSDLSHFISHDCQVPPPPKMGLLEAPIGRGGGGLHGGFLENYIALCAIFIASSPIRGYNQLTRRKVLRGCTS